MEYQPHNVFYTVVCEADDSPKACSPSQTINSYHTSSFAYPNGGVSNTPTLFVTKAEAEELQTKATKGLKSSSLAEQFTFKIIPIRICESHWGYSTDSHNCAVLDAKEITSGLMHYDEISAEIKKLAGKLLTIVDAAYVNESQNKAVKDLMKNGIRTQLNQIYEKSHREFGEECGEGSSQKDILDD